MSWERDFKRVSGPREDTIRTGIRSGEGGLDAAAAHENMGGRLEFLRNMQARTAMRGSPSGLQSCNFETKFVERVASLVTQIVVWRTGFWKEVARNRQTLAVHEVCRRSLDVGLKSRSD